MQIPGLTGIFASNYKPTKLNMHKIQLTNSHSPNTPLTPFHQRNSSQKHTQSHFNSISISIAERNIRKTFYENENLVSAEFH